MCRIAGYWDFNYRNEYDIGGTAVRMRDTMTYGGPDDAGVYVEQDTALALAHRRLSILDLSSLGHQPMSDDDGNLWVTYNGEVYNFHEIKQELIAKGHKFTSNSDTEVILEAHKEWGLDAVHRFRGMFAYALWNRRKKELTLCRDRVGVKPLYWHFNDGVFMFASEVKAFHAHPKFHKEIDRRSVSTFLTFGYIPSPHSIFCNTFKLEPGHFLIIDNDRKIIDIKYWDIRDSYLKGVELEKSGYWARKKEEEIADELEEILRRSFRYRMVADVPVGVFLSGGFDSSTLAALLTLEGFKLKTFTIGFDVEGYSEALHAERIARHLSTDHTELLCTAKEAFEIIPKLPDMYDEPFGDASAIPTHLVSILARQKVTVSLSADGGDELFCGYDKYQTVKKRMERQRRLGVLPFISKVMGLVDPNDASALYRTFSFVLPKYADIKHKYAGLRDRLKANTIEEQFFLAQRYFFEEELCKHNLPHFYGRDVDTSGVDDYHTMMLVDFKNYLPDDVLVKVDRASMAVALEGREPFLDNKAIEYVATLPSSLKYKAGASKHILRKITYKYIPKDLLDRPKQGFGVPIEIWFKKDLKTLFVDYLSEERLNREGLFDARVVQALLKDYLEGFAGYNVRLVTRLWYLLVFEMWMERWMTSRGRVGEA